MLQAPAQELGVAQRYQKPGAREFFGRADERGEIIVGFRDRVREMADASCVAADASLTLDDFGPALGNHLHELAIAVVAEHTSTQCITGVEVQLGRRADSITMEC